MFGSLKGAQFTIFQTRKAREKWLKNFRSNNFSSIKIFKNLGHIGNKKAISNCESRFTFLIAAHFFPF